MISELAYFPILGKPLVLYMGVSALLLFICTASIGFMIFRGVGIPFRFHPILAGISVAVGIFHGILGGVHRQILCSSYWNYHHILISNYSIYWAFNLQGKTHTLQVSPTMAITAIIVGITHGSLGISIYL